MTPNNLTESARFRHNVFFNITSAIALGHVTKFQLDVDPLLAPTDVSIQIFYFHLTFLYH
jgi:hypothetical protein